jgi:CheY-like chemotaxis protein
MSGRVLVVDDEDSIRLLIKRLLTRYGFTVDTAANGEAAIEKLDHDPYDAIVLDLMMPRIDGFGVIRHLEATNPSLVPKTVVATAYPREATGSGLQEVCRVIIKPFDAVQLVEAVQSCVAA